jgi:hypothetical protein
MTGSLSRIRILYRWVLSEVNKGHMKSDATSRIKKKSESIKAFAAEAIDFCAIIENRAKLNRTRFFQALYLEIPKLISSASTLPNDLEFKIIKRNKVEEQNEWKSLFNHLKKKFGNLDYYQEIFDPYEKIDLKPVFGSLSDDIADIYREIKPGTINWEKKSKTQKERIAGNWHFFFEIHWGEHATSALRALYFLLYRKIEKKNGMMVGLTGISK